MHFWLLNWANQLMSLMWPAQICGAYLVIHICVWQIWHIDCLIASAALTHRAEACTDEWKTGHASWSLQNNLCLTGWLAWVKTLYHGFSMESRFSEVPIPAKAECHIECLDKDLIKVKVSSVLLMLNLQTLICYVAIFNGPYFAPGTSANPSNVFFWLGNLRDNPERLYQFPPFWQGWVTWCQVPSNTSTESVLWLFGVKTIQSWTQSHCFICVFGACTTL